MEEHESTPTRTRNCKPSKITRNTKLTGAKLTDMGTVDDLEDCIKHCCSKDSCDVAYMEEQKCYAVQCQDGLQCKSFRKPARKDENILIAYMQRSLNDAEKEKGNPSYPIPSYPIPSYPIPSYPILSHPIPSYSIPSHPILHFSLINSTHFMNYFIK